MKVILLERIGSSGGIGDDVTVKNGYARNYLIPQGKAVRVTPENRQYFESRRTELLKAETDRLIAAQARAAALEGVEITISGRVTEEGRLYGSIGAREVVTELARVGHEIDRHEVNLPDGNIREPGEFQVELILHAEVNTEVQVVVVPEQA